MKKSKLSIVALIISLLPFVTLIVSAFTKEITAGVQMGLVAMNSISILTGFVLSIVLVKNPKRRDVFSIIALCISGFLGLLMVGIIAFDWWYSGGFNILFLIPQYLFECIHIRKTFIT